MEPAITEQSSVVSEVSNTEVAKPEIGVGTHFFNQRYLYAFATQGELINHVRTQTLDARRLSEILALWQTQQPFVQQLMAAELGVADQSVLGDLPVELGPRLREIAADPLMAKSFLHVPITFALVEIDTLVAPQRYVNEDYAAKLKEKYKASTGLEQLLEICLSPVREMAPIQHLEVGNNAHVFSSPNLDIRHLGAFLKRLSSDDLQFAELGGIPAAAIISFVGYGANAINAIRYNGRLVLNNGFHRVYALRSLGVTKIPIVVQHVRNPQLEFPGLVCGLPREYLLGAPRPVLMKDFVDDSLCIALRAKDRVKVVTVQAAVGSHDVPA